MTTVAIPLVYDGAANVVPAAVDVQLVDATGKPVIGLRGIQLTTEYQGLALEDESLEIELTPQVEIAMPDGAATYYRIAIRTAHRTEVYVVQVPDQGETINFADLVAGTAVDPADILSGRLLPPASEYPESHFLSIQNGTWVPVESPAGWGIPDAPDSVVYVRQSGVWRPLAEAAVDPAQVQGTNTMVLGGKLGLAGTVPTAGTSLRADVVRTNTLPGVSAEVFGRGKLSASGDHAAIGLWGETRVNGAIVANAMQAAIYGEANNSTGAGSVATCLNGVRGQAVGRAAATVQTAVGVSGAVSVDDSNVSTGVAVLAQEATFWDEASGSLDHSVGVGVARIDNADTVNAQVYLARCRGWRSRTRCPPPRPRSRLRYSRWLGAPVR